MEKLFKWKNQLNRKKVKWKKWLNRKQVKQQNG